MNSLKEQILLLASTPLYILIIGGEILLGNYQHRKLYTLKDSLNNLYLMLINSGLDLFSRASYLILLQFFYIHNILSIHNAVAYWILLLISEDFIYYWLHRFDHEIRFFWAVHVTHHSSEKMNFTVGFRSSAFQPLYRFIYFIPLAWTGFRPIDILFVYSATQIWGILVHTELVGKMGILEYFMVTPSHHRVHHASNPKYLDKNMGMFLIVWDKLFGTYQPELPDFQYQPKKYGLTKNLEKRDAIHIVFHEWINIFRDICKEDLTWKQRWNYIFGPPGWSHDGSSLTSKQIREKEDLII